VVLVNRPSLFAGGKADLVVFARILKKGSEPIFWFSLLRDFQLSEDLSMMTKFFLFERLHAGSLEITNRMSDGRRYDSLDSL
jgi:hypothetical protein